MFAQQDVDDLLKGLGVRTQDLMPKGDYNVRVNLTGAGGADPATFPPFLPLQVFDDVEYDCRNPHEWLQLGVVDGKQNPVPGKALLSKVDSTRSLMDFRVVFLTLFPL